jgi:hypothetical protein
LKSINATLLANQRLPNGRGYATATLADNGRLHPTSVVTDAYTGGKTIAVECGTSYVRIRYKSGGSGTLESQKISDPTVGAQWTTWAALVAANVFSAGSVALFWTGTYAVVVWQDTPTGDIKYKRSSDGTTWSATGVARATLVAGANSAGVSGTSPNCGIMTAYNAQIYWQAYNDATNTWAAAESAGAVFTSVLPEIAAFKDTINNRYIVAVSVQGYATWATYTVVAYTRAVGAATWSTGQIIFSGNGVSGSFSSLNFAQRQIGGYWWLSFCRLRLWNVGAFSNFMISASNDGLYWDDPLPTPVVGNELTLSILPAPSGGTWANAYWSTERAVYRLDTYTYWSAAVVAYHFITGRGGHQEGGGLNAKGGVSPTVPTTQSTLVALLDNRDGSLTTPRLFSIFTLNRGLVVLGVSFGQSAGTWYVTDFRYLTADGLLEITATDARGLLSSWFADTAYTYRGATVKFLVEWICALAGVHTVAFDGFAAWTDTIAAYTHPIAENAIFSLKSLSQRVPFEYVPQEDGSLYFYVPSAAPAPVYTFGTAAGEHQAWVTANPRAVANHSQLITPSLLDSPSWSFKGLPWFGGSESVTYLQDIGSPPRNRVGQAVDQTALNTMGRRRTLILNDRRLRSDADTTEAANALLVAAQERKRAGAFDAPPSFALEPADVVTINNGGYAQTAGPWRVEQFEEHFNLPGARPFFQRITLRGTA